MGGKRRLARRLSSPSLLGPIPERTQVETDDPAVVSWSRALDATTPDPR
jgi:hypothetical protein